MEKKKKKKKEIKKSPVTDPFHSLTDYFTLIDLIN